MLDQHPARQHHAHRHGVLPGFQQHFALYKGTAAGIQRGQRAGQLRRE